MKKISRPSVALEASSTLLSSPISNHAARFNKDINYEDSSIPCQYPHKLSLYLQAPAYEITIEDFEELALARLERN